MKSVHLPNCMGFKSKNNMLKIIYFTITTFLLSNSFAQAPAIQWAKCFGGSGNESATSLQQTADGGYIVAGNTNSIDGDVSGLHVNIGSPDDFWVVKLDATGTLQWQKCLGGTLQDNATSIQQTADGGYIVAGYTVSNNGNVSGLNGGSGSPADFWVVKLDISGTLQWQKCLGGKKRDWAFSIQQTLDSGYIVAGLTLSNDGNVSGFHGGTGSPADFWVVKLNKSGTLQWQKCLGGTDGEGATAVQQTTDGGYIVAGNTVSNDYDVSGNHGSGSSDFWIVKLNTIGTLQWQKCLGGSYDGDGATSIQQTSDGGYIAAGYTYSNNGDVSGLHGLVGTNDYSYETDFWIVKLDNVGTLQWQKCLGGSKEDRPTSIQETSDGGYIVCGYTNSIDGDVSGLHAVNSADVWVVKLDISGTLQWQKCLGGSNQDVGSVIRQTSDGGYIVGGYTVSNDYDVSNNHGNYDFWVVKLGSLLLPIKLSNITAVNKGNYNLIQWSTASEDPDEFFELQYSTDGIHFYTITTITGKGMPANYEYMDKQPMANENYYRLYMPKNDLEKQYSKIVLVKLKNEIKYSFSVSPNPAKTQLYFSEKLKKVEVYDMNGQLQVIANETDNLNIQSLIKGIYLLKGITYDSNIVNTIIEKN